MRLRLYGGPAGWLLVPERLPTEAIPLARYQPLTGFGTVHAELIPRVFLTQVFADLYRDLYAEIPRDLGIRLVKRSSQAA
jgi:hypothetical protein